MKFTFTNDNEMLEFADKTCYGRYDMTVVDGTNSNIMKNLFVNREPNHRLIICTSFDAISFNSECHEVVKDHFTMLLRTEMTGQV